MINLEIKITAGAKSNSFKKENGKKSQENVDLWSFPEYNESV